MAYDIYGNVLRRGYCEVHPEVPESYPCSRCQLHEDIQKEVEQQPHPTVMDYILFDGDKFKEAAEDIINADKQDNETDFISAVENLVKILNIGFISSILSGIMKRGE